MTINPSDLQAVVESLEAGEELSERDLQLLATAVRSRQITIATGERAVAIGGSADGATIITGNGNFFFDGANVEPILNLLRERGLPDSPRVAPLPRVRLPDNFVPRPDALNAVKAKLLGEDDKTLVVSAIAGLGGIGKSVLAIAVVLDPEVQARFEDGILWVTLGQNPDLLSLLGDWIRELDKSREAFSANTLEAAAQYLGTLLAERRMLLVVDDVWNAAHAEWFRVGGGGCRVLVTTREAIIQGAERCSLDLMSPQEALALIKGELGNKWTEAMEQPALEFARLLGYLPLALKLMAIQVVRGKKWETLKKAFLHETERFRSLDYPGVRLKDLSEDERRRYSLRACFQISLERLKNDREEYFERFLWLGVLPEDVEIRESMAKTLWNVEDWEAEETLLELYERSFLTSGVDTIEGERSYRIHDLMHDLARISIDCPPSNESNQLGGLGMNVAAAHREFLDRYRAQAEDRRWDKLPSDGYIHRRLTWHMIQAGWLDEIHALMAMSDDRGNNAWFEACDRIGQPAIFVEDVARAWELAEQMYASEPTRSIVLQCRYALITATLNTLVVKLSVEMMTEFVKKGFWTVEQAWAYVEQMQDEKKVVEAIEALAPSLTKSLLTIVLGKARTIKSEYYLAKVLSSLAAIDSAYFSELLTTARAIKSESIRAEVLSSLAAIDNAYFSDALTAARAIKSESIRAKVLSSLVAVDGADFAELLTVAGTIQSEYYRAKVLSSLAAIDNTYFSEALTVARAIQDEYYRAEILSSLETIENVYFSQELMVTRAIKFEDNQTDMLSSLTASDSAYFSQELIAVRAIQDEYYRAEVLSNLAAIDNVYFSEALTAASVIQDEYYRAEVLSNLAAIDGTNFTELLIAARAIQDELNRAKVLSNLAVIDNAYFSEALTVAQAIQDKSYRAEMLSSLAAIDGANFTELLIAARAIQDEYYRAEVLSSLAAIDGADFTELLIAARAIQGEFNRAKVLSSLVAVEGANFTELLRATRTLQSNYCRASVLSSLAAIDNAYFSEALTVARTIQSEFYFRASILSSLAVIDNTYFLEALTVARAIQDESYRAKVLSSLAVIDDADFAEVLIAAAIQDEYYRIDVLSGLAKHAPMKFSTKIWDAICSITHEPTRVKALSDCLPHFPLDKLSHHDYCEYLHLLAYRQRSYLMADLVKLYPAILHLGGATAMRGVVDAMNEVCSQWR